MSKISDKALQLSENKLVNLLDKYMGNDFLMNNGLAKWLLENDLIVPPCNIGDTVYLANPNTLLVKELRVDYFDIFQNSVNFTFKIHLVSEKWSDFVFLEDFGKTVFFTREEAIQSLRGDE